MDNPVAVYFCGIFIYWHGIIIALAAICAAACAALLRRAQGESAKDILIIALAGFVPAMAAGRAFYCYFMQESFASGSQMLRLGDGGVALYGTAVGYLVTILVYCAVKKKNTAQMLDAIAPATALGICIGRMASYFSGDDVGRAVQNEKLWNTPFAIYSAESGEYELAVFALEALTALVIFGVLIIFCFISGSKKINVKNGDIACLFLLMYGITQTVYESMRGDSLFLISLGFVRISQIISIILATVSFVIFSIRSAKKGLTWIHWTIWSLCLACIALAFWMEFCMTSATAVRNYTIMSLCLAFYLFSGLALYLDASATENSLKHDDSVERTAA